MSSARDARLAHVTPARVFRAINPGDLTNAGGVDRGTVIAEYCNVTGSHDSSASGLVSRLAGAFAALETSITVLPADTSPCA